jgi:hypothetical protein
MAVDGDVYGTIARVEALVGDLVSSRTFSGSTTPTTVEVEGFIDDEGFRLNSELEQMGYTTPVVVGTDKNAFNWLRAANSAGAAGLVLSALPAESWIDPDNEGPAQSRRQGLEQQMTRIIKAIREGRLPASKATVKKDQITIGSELDSDGNTKLPIFSRSIMDNPSSRSLVDN